MRAATSMFLISLAKSLPRLASMPAFLCFVVAHLEWPLTVAPLVPGGSAGLSARWRRTMSTNIACTRRSPVSSGWKLVATRFPWRTATILPSAGSPARPGPTPRRRPLLDPGRPDEDRVHGTALRGLEVEVGLEGVDLPPNALRGARSRPGRRSSPAGGGVQDPVGEQDHPGAGAVGGQPGVHGGAQRLEQLEPVGELDDRRRLAPGITSPSTAASSSGRRTVTASAPCSRSAARCSRTSPCRASTPMTGRTVSLDTTTRLRRRPG